MAPPNRRKRPDVAVAQPVVPADRPSEPPSAGRFFRPPGKIADIVAAVFRWPENVALGPVPAHGSLAQMREFEAQRFAAVAV